MKTPRILAAALAASMTVAAGADCPGDADGSGVVDVIDLLQVIGDYYCVAVCPGSDVDDDGVVGVQDLLIVIGDWGCQTSVGAKTQLSGLVTNVWTGAGIAGASVQVGDDVVATDQFGAYDGSFPVGLHDVTFTADDYMSQETTIVLFPNLPLSLDAALEPTSPVIVNIIVQDSADPGDMVDAYADVSIFDGSTIQSYAWTQTGAPAQIAGEDTDTATLTLASRAEYKQHLFDLLAEPPIGPEQLPPNVPPPSEEFPGGLQSRFEVAGLNHFVLEETGLVGLEVDVTTTSGTYSDEEELDTHIPWKPTSGIRNVPIGIPVLLNGKEQASYDWTLDPPAGSGAALLDDTTRHPDFTPDIPGLYNLFVTETGTEAGVLNLQVYAGNWRGVIVGEDADGRPVSDPACTGCHVNLGFDKFTPWEDTGHAEIFTNLLNENSHYSTACFDCHSVGYDPDAVNNGFDDQPDYQDFLNAGLLANPSPDNWSTMLVDYPWSAQQSNAQCENCHGPQWALPGQGTLAHGPVGPMGEPRVSLSANVCGRCHGEPLRHGRFQQWQLSAHANYELAIDEGDSGSCSRCHTVNGFLTWLPILLGDEPGDPTDDITVTWTTDETHPQTCATCHDPHAAGTVSGEPNNATVRISGNTPPLIAGFTAYAVGRGAICMTCHNSRRGLRNDTTWPDFEGTSEASRAPHGSAQTDLLMGENAYLMTVGNRGNHSFLADTCAQCHMVQTPPPDDLSYNQGGTNHTFFAARDICANCHTGFDADTIQGSTHDLLDQLQDALESAILALMADQIALGRTIDLDGDAVVTDTADILDIEFGESRGRQAITVTFTDMTVFGPYAMSNVEVLDGAMQSLGDLYDFADPGLPKAGWNYALVHNDSSGGVHNPSFAYGTLAASLEAVDPLGAAALSPPWWVDMAKLGD